MTDNILWLITARSGSKSIEHKNIKSLGGLPLLAYRIKTALAISKKENVWCSTDSEVYAKIAKDFGATVPFIRPEHLSTNEASSVGVVRHAMNVANEMGLQFDYIGLLEPTSPFVYKADIEKALSILSNNDLATGIVSVKESRPNTIFIQDESEYLDKFSEQINALNHLGRQNFKRQITPSGGFYISDWKFFEDVNSFYTKSTLSYLLPEECALEIDENIDWLWAEFLLEKNIVKQENLFS